VKSGRSRSTPRFTCAHIGVGGDESAIIWWSAALLDLRDFHELVSLFDQACRILETFLSQRIGSPESCQRRA
jgi:hypothetical protein